MLKLLTLTVFFGFFSILRWIARRQHPRYSTPAFQTTSHVIEAIGEHPWVLVSGPGVPAIGRPNWDFGTSAGKNHIDVAHIIPMRESILAEFQPL